MRKKTKKTAWKIFGSTLLLFPLILPPFIALAAETNPPMERELLQSLKEEETLENLREQRRLLGDNALLETQIRMLEYRLHAEPEEREVELFPSNIGIDLSGGLTHFLGTPFSWIQNLQKITEDSAGQIGNESLSIPSLSEDALVLIRQSLEKFRTYTGHYPESLDEFLRYPDEEWANIFFARQNRNIAEFRGELSYEYHSQENRALTSKLSPEYVFPCFSYFAKTCENSFLESGYTPKNETCSQLISSIPADKTIQKLHLLLDKKDSILTLQEDQGQKEKTAKILGSVLQEANINCCRESSFLAMSGQACGPQSLPGGKNETYSLSLTTLPERVSLENIEGVYPEEEPKKKSSLSDENTIFRNVPEDDLLISFSSGKDFLKFLDAISPLSNAIKTLLPVSSISQERNIIEKRLGVKDLAELMSATEEIAIIFEDIGWPSVNDFALIIRPKGGTEEIWKYVFRTGNNEFGRMGHYLVIASHHSLFEHIKKAYGGISPNMEESSDFQQGIMALDERRNGEIFFSRAFLKKISDPEYQIKQNRRERVLAAMETLQYVVWAYWGLENVLPATFQNIENRGYIAEGSIWNPEGFSIGEDGIVTHETWGSIFHPTPLGRISLKTASRAEVAEYETFRSSFQSSFGNLVESLGIGITLSDQIGLQTLFFSKENETRQILKNALSGGEREWFDAQDSGILESVFQGTLSIDFSTFLAEMGVGFSGALKNAPDEIRENDLSVLQGILQKYKTENGYYPPSLEALVETGYLGSIPLDPDGSEYEYVVFPDSNSEVKDQCYRLSAQLSSQSLQKMKSDNGIDPNALEVGECFLSHSFPLYEPRNEETEDNMWKEAAAGIFREWLSERFSIPSLLGVLGSLKNEIHFGLDSQTLWKEILFSSPDAPLLTRFQSLIFLALPLRETGETEQILNSLVESAIAQKIEMADGSYIVLPKSDRRPPLFLGIHENALIISLQEKTLQDILAVKTTSFPLQRSRAFLPKNILSLSNFSLKLLGKMLQESAGEAFLQEALRRQVRYVQEALTVANILPHSDGSLKNTTQYYQNIPESFLHWSIVVSNNTIFFNGNPKQISCTIRGCDRALGQLVPEAFPEDFFLKNTSSDEFQNVLNTYSNITFGFRFSETEATLSAAFQNPFSQEIDTRFALPKPPEKQGILSRIFVPIFSPARYGNLLFENLETPIRIILLGIGGTVIALLIGFSLSPLFWRNNHQDPSQENSEEKR